MRLGMAKRSVCFPFRAPSTTSLRVLWSQKMSSKWPREYERVPGLDEIDRNDFVALTKARQQWVRDR